MMAGSPPRGWGKELVPPCRWTMMRARLAETLTSLRLGGAGAIVRGNPAPRLTRNRCQSLFPRGGLLSAKWCLICGSSRHEVAPFRVG